MSGGQKIPFLWRRKYAGHKLRAPTSHPQRATSALLKLCSRERHRFLDLAKKGVILIKKPLETEWDFNLRLKPPAGRF